MSVITITSDTNQITVSSGDTQGGVSIVSSSVSSSNTVSQTDPDSILSINNSSGTINNVLLSDSTSNDGINVLSGGPSANTITINQGQQGPAGTAGIFSVLNYGENRLLTSSSSESIISAQSNLLFNGTLLSVNGTGVSLEGHSHLSSSITDLTTSIDSRMSTNLAEISAIDNLCNLSYILTKDVSNNFKLISKNNLVNIITEIDGGGVINSEC